MKTIYFLLAIPLFFSCAKQKETLSPPNILYIMSDDHASHAISSYGGIYNEYFQTPNIDRLASEGMRFNNVFCTNGICGPSRASILTGKYSHVNGYYKNEKGGEFNPKQWTFPQSFQKGGYETALFGKWHLESEPVGFDYFKFFGSPNQQGDYYNPLYNENGVLEREQGYSTILTTNFALDWLKTKHKQNKPFMVLLQYKAPHRPWFPEEKYKNLFEGIELPYPSTFEDDYSTREHTAGNTDMTMDFFNPIDMKLTPPDGLDKDEFTNWKNTGNMRGQGEGWLPNDTMSIQEARRWKYQRFIKDYLACIKSVDDNIGRVLKYLDDSGLAENTVVVYTSDQGFYLGDHGWFDKRFMYEPSLRMPFLLRYPSTVKKESVNNDIIANIDFAPTLLDLAGIEIPAEVQGRSFKMNLLDKTPADWPHSMYYHYYEYPFWHHVQPHYGIRNERYKLIHFYYDIDVWEFYDLQTDPEELNNQIDNPAYADIIAEMKQEIMQKQKKYGDDKTLEEYREITDKDFGIKK